MKFWSALAVQLLAIALRDAERQQKFSQCIGPSPVQSLPEVVCQCEVTTPKADSGCFLTFCIGVSVGLLIGIFVGWVLFRLTTLKPSTDESPTGRSGNRRRRGLGVLSESEAWAEDTTLVSG